MRTTHRLLVGDSRDLSALASASVELVVTSPPYPMIAMWDEVFSAMSDPVAAALGAEEGERAFALMHDELDRVWSECHRLVVPGGLVCINIGDATRSIGDRFRLFSNHARIIAAMTQLGFDVLPDIIWRKPTNAPTKFMGSGMLPAGAYVTYEHEYVLVFRKGGRRTFRAADARARRQRSAYFWEERNRWFSDVWTDLVGTPQKMSAGASRTRSAAFPLELPLRIIQMYSLQGDVVLDPFSGTGTTSLAAMCTGRSSVGVELSESVASAAEVWSQAVPSLSRRLAQDRLKRHEDFVTERRASGRVLKYHNAAHDIAVMTRQEQNLQILCADDVVVGEDGVIEVHHSMPD